MNARTCAPAGEREAGPPLGPRETARPLGACRPEAPAAETTRGADGSRTACEDAQHLLADCRFWLS